MASTSLPLKIIDTSRVAPSPGITPDCASLPFTFFDHIMTKFTPVDRLLFYSYRHPTVHFLSSHLTSLKRSLSLTLATYYPLAGSYRRKPGTDNMLEHYYKEGDGVSFTVAECVDGRFEDLANYHEREVSQLDYLAPLLPKSGDDEESKPVLAVQVTVFPKQGIVIGTSMHHSVCDESSFMSFMHTWSETCLSGVLSSSQVPVFDRSLFSKTCYPILPGPFEQFPFQPGEWITSVIGYRGRTSQDNWNGVRALTFETSETIEPYGPYGKEVGTEFELPANMVKLLLSMDALENVLMHLEFTLRLSNWYWSIPRLLRLLEFQAMTILGHIYLYIYLCEYKPNSLRRSFPGRDGCYVCTTYTSSADSMLGIHQS